MSVVREELLATLAKLKKRILEIEKSSMKLSEQDTRQGLINSLFRSLGWDFSDFTTVRSEFRHKMYNEPVDYAFFARGSDEKPLLLVEAKAFGSNLQDGKIIKQMCSYMGTMGVQWGLLTDGNKYVMYNSNAGTSFEEQKFLTLQIKTADTEDGLNSEELADKLIALISRDCLENNGIQKFYREHMINRHIEDALWSLLSEPFDTLAAAIKKEFKQERVKIDPNIRVSTQQIIDYLKTIKDEEGRIPFTISDEVCTTDDNLLQDAAQSQQEGSYVSEVVARRTKLITIADLLADGLVKASDNWRFSYKGEFIWGRITSNGEIDVNGKLYSNPSKAAAWAMQGGCNGWWWWEYKDLDGKWQKIDTLREQYRKRHGLEAVHWHSKAS